MALGQNVRMLQIDLSKRSFTFEELPDDVVRRYIGGRGLGACLLYNLVPAGADPLGPDNHVIFTAGPLSGTGFFYSSKANLTTKSPLTGIYLYSICSGILAQEMKKSGFWVLDIKGRAEFPTYLAIEDGRVEFRDATDLWTMETMAAQNAMIGQSRHSRTASVGIGPAGENLIPFAAVFGGGESYRCFGRGGAGAVMGSKNLKGLVVTGAGRVEASDKARFLAANGRIAHRLKTDCKGWAEWWRRYETAADLETMNALGVIPTRNWQTGQFDGWSGIDKSTAPMGWPLTVRPCGPYCPTAGTREAVVEQGPYKGAHSDIEWEAIYAFGSQCGIDKMEAILAASQICDEFGIDNMSAGVTIGFAMECFEKGLLKLSDTDGIDLRFGNDSAMILALRQLVRQEGFGRLLAKGTKKMSEQIGGSEPFAMHAKGMEFGGYECRGLNGQALQFAVSPRGGCHHAYGLPARIETSDGSRLDVEGKGEQVKNAAIGRIICDSMVVCTFPASVYTRDIQAEAISAAVGEEISPADLNEAGERVMCQERLFNAREGLSRKDDTLPLRLLGEPKPDGPTKGAVVPLEELKDSFYKAMEYDPATGNPTDAVLTRLGVEK